MAKMPAGCADLIMTSPPYNLRNTTGGNNKGDKGAQKYPVLMQKGYSCHDDCMPHAQYVAWQRKCLQAMMRVLSKKGAIFYNHKWCVQGGVLP